MAKADLLAVQREFLLKNPASMRVQATGFTRPFVQAAILTAGLWAIHAYLLKPLPQPINAITGFFNLDALRVKLFEEGPIPFVILGVFLFGLGYLLHLWGRLLNPLANSLIGEGEMIDAVHRRDDPALVLLLNQRSRLGQLGHVGANLHRLRFRHGHDQDLSAVISLKNDIVKSDEDDIAGRFVALMWVEGALPLLGFLGTVVGIGAALGKIEEAVFLLIQQGAQQSQGMSKLGAGFRDMALAFDTTFIGLCGLLAIVLGHMFVKKRILARLNQLERVLTEAVAQWSSDNPLVAQIASIPAAVAILIERATQAITRADQRAAEFRAETRSAALQVIDTAPSLREVREALFRPIVEFGELGREMSDRLSKEITQSLKSEAWKFVGLAPCASAGPSFVAVVETETGAHLVAADRRSRSSVTVVPIKARPQALYVTDARASILARAGTKLVHATAGTLKEVATPFTASDFASCARVGREPAVLIVRTSAGTTTVEVHGPGSTSDRRQLPTDADWASFTVHARSGLVVALGASRADKAGQLFLLRPRAERQADRQAAKDGTPKPVRIRFSDAESFPLSLPPGLSAASVTCLGPRDGVILDDQGRLHYWDESRTLPLHLAHEEWRSDPKAVIVPGARRWIAAFADKHLSMWHIAQGGRLSPYPGKRLEVSGLAKELVTSTMDGRILLAVSGDRRRLIGWEFPRVLRDTLR